MTGDPEPTDALCALVDRELGRAVVATERAAWGFTNRTDVLTLADGERVVLQCFRHRPDAERRLRVMEALHAPAAAAGIALPRALAAGLAEEPPWMIVEALPGVPVPEAWPDGLADRRFTALARAMGELLTAFRRLRAGGLEFDDLWAVPEWLAVRAQRWARESADVGERERHTALTLLARIPVLFADRPVVLAHGDFVPVNVLTDGTRITGLLDLESVRLADPLFDAAWWSWAVGFGPPGVLAATWPAFLAAADIEHDDPALAERITILQVARMLELLAGSTLERGIRAGVAAQLRATLA